MLILFSILLLAYLAHTFYRAARADEDMRWDNIIALVLFLLVTIGMVIGAAHVALDITNPEFHPVEYRYDNF